MSVENNLREVNSLLSTCVSTLGNINSNTVDLVKSTNNITDNAVLRGDGGSKGVQESSVYIDDNGQLGIGTSSPVEILTINGSMTTTANEFLGFNTYYDGKWRAYNGTERVGAVKHEYSVQNSIQFRTGTGTFSAGAEITWQPIPYVSNGTFINASDDRLKTDEAFITNATDTIMKLRPEIYTKHGIIEDENGDVTVNHESESFRESGLIAQEIYYLAPELRHLVSLPEGANPIEDGVVIPDDPKTDLDYESLGWSRKMAGVKYTGLIPYLIKCCQEQQAVIEDLKARIQVLETA